MRAQVLSFYDYQPKEHREPPNEPATIIILPVVLIEGRSSRRPTLPKNEIK